MILGMAFCSCLPSCVIGGSGIQPPGNPHSFAVIDFFDFFSCLFAKIRSIISSAEAEV